MTVGIWWRERREVQALDKAEADSRARLQKALDGAKSSGARADDLERIRQDHLIDVFSYQDRRAVIQSQQLARKARRLMLPIPPRTENSDI